MTYQECLDYIFSSLPMFHRIGAAAYKADLTTTINLCNHIGNPQTGFKSVHIAGTNGKGSVSNMLAAVLQSAGYNTGLFTSPHLRDFRERIRINGEMIPEQKVADFINRNQSYFDLLKPSFFEMTAALAFEYFKESKVEVAVIETGMGGRLDSTNVVDPLISVITNIGYDHTAFLGNTLKRIAFEKAGIIKPLKPVIIGESHPETEPVFREVSTENKSSIFFAGQILRYEHLEYPNNYTSGFSLDIYKGDELLYDRLTCQLSGIYQVKNILTVLQTIEILRSSGFNLSESHIRDGLSSVYELTGFMGRWQVISRNPLVICDTGHNVDGITEVVKQISLIPHKNLHYVFGMVNDKDVSSILELMPKNARYYFCKPNVPRGLDVEILAREANAAGLKGFTFNSVRIALQSAISASEREDLIMVGGSTFVVAEVI